MTWWFDTLDRMRRLQGVNLDLLGLGPEETHYTILFSRPGARLRHYENEQPETQHQAHPRAPDGSSAHSENSKDEKKRPVMLILPAPIKGPYIWDISPEKSVVKQALKRGFDVYLVEWAQANEQTTELGLENCITQLLAEFVELILKRTGQQKVVLMGHSLGGTFAGLYSAYRPEQVAAVVLVEAPLRFGEGSGAFAQLLKTGVPAHDVLPNSPHVPGTVLGAIATHAAPGTFRWERHLDYLLSLGSIRHLQNHWRGVRWSLDELAIPQQLFEDVVEQLYREDRFMRGELSFGTKQLDPADVTAPLLAIYDPKSRIVPPDSVFSFYDCAKSQQKKAVAYRGDIGVTLQHLGALTGDNAHRYVWPEVFDWLQPTITAEVSARH